MDYANESTHFVMVRQEMCAGWDEKSQLKISAEE